MSSSGKITTISCLIVDLGAKEPISHSLDFQPIVPNGHTFYAAQRFNQFNSGHHNKWVIDVDKCSCILYSSFVRFKICKILLTLSTPSRGMRVQTYLQHSINITIV